MFVRRFAVVALLAAAAGPVIAQDTAPATASAKPAKPPKEKKTCRYDTPTGSNIPTSTCHTASEWAQIDGAQSAIADDMKHSVIGGGSQGH